MAFSLHSAAIAHTRHVSDTSLDFGYPWWLTYGHLIVLVPALVALLAGIVRRWPLVVKVGLALVVGAGMVAIGNADLAAE